MLYLKGRHKLFKKLDTVTIIHWLKLDMIYYQIDISATATEHAYRSLETIANKIKRKLKMLIEDSNIKLTEIAKIEKDASNSVDVLEKNCEEMMNKVERLSREQVKVYHSSFE